MSETTEALWYVAPGRAELRQTALPPLLPGWVEIAATHSALSRGTERLVLEGRVPQSEWQRMRAPMQEGDFPFPVKYGYALVGEVVDGDPARLGQPVFALAPHQRRLRLPGAAAMPIPDGVPPARATLAANMETALNAIWDAEIPPGSRVAIVGAGLLGCLIAALLSRQSDLELTMCDVLEARRALASEFNVTFAFPTELADDHVVVFHSSATQAGLSTALDALAFEGRVLELSWFGDKAPQVPLGGAFHARRLTIQCSQVGHVARPRRAATTHRDRLARALACLDDPRLDQLITGRLAFDRLADDIPRLLAPRAPGIATVVEYL
ncbi:MAG: zinc-binding alcohol dehydrogenase [Pikeienuella sp.]